MWFLTLRRLSLKSIVVLSSLATLFLAGCMTPQSVFREPETEAAVLNMYNDRLARWPVPHESRYVGTSYGVAHVTVSGPQGAPPLLMLHAMGVTSTMWRSNVAALSKDHRVFCLDFIGDLGRSRLYDLDRYPADGAEVAGWLTEVLDKLDIPKARVVGASYGGWAALQLASHFPQRVDRLALIGPMGVASLNPEVLGRILSLVLLPTEEKKRAMVDWTLGDSPVARKELEEYMHTAMSSAGRMAIPHELSEADLQRVRAPVLLVLAEKDGPVGAPAGALARARPNIADLAILEVAGAGHMISVEQSRLVDETLTGFFAGRAPRND